MEESVGIAEMGAAIALAGLIGTGGMTLVMHLITRAGIANANMVQAIGSLVTKSLDNATVVGAVIHTISGLIFAALYTGVMMYVGANGILGAVAVGSLLGFAHGFVLSFLLVIWVAENHPLQEFKEAGAGVAAAHFAGHVVYGFLVGLVIGFSGVLG